MVVQGGIFLLSDTFLMSLFPRHFLIIIISRFHKFIGVFSLCYFLRMDSSSLLFSHSLYCILSLDNFLRCIFDIDTFLRKVVAVMNIIYESECRQPFSVSRYDTYNRTRLEFPIFIEFLHRVHKKVVNKFPHMKWSR